MKEKILPRTLDIASVSTRLCFDSETTTNLIALLKRLGIVRGLQHPLIRKKIVDFVEKSHWGQKAYAVKAEVTGLLNGRQYPPGVFHIEELFQPVEVFSSLRDTVTFEEQVIQEKRR